MNFDIKYYLSNTEATDKIHSEMIEVYEKRVMKYINNLLHIIMLHMTRTNLSQALPCEIKIITEKDENKQIKYNTINKCSPDVDIFMKLKLPYYYIIFTKEFINKKYTGAIDIILNENLLKEYDDACKRPDQHMILMRRYLGMGHYLVLSTFINNIDDDIHKPNYFIWLVGGSNGYDQDSSWSEFNKLNIGTVIDLRNLKTFRGALKKLITFDIKKDLDVKYH